MRKCESLEPLQLPGYSRLTRAMPTDSSTKPKKEHRKSVVSDLCLFSSSSIVSPPSKSFIHQEVKTQCLQCCFYCCFRYFHQHLVRFNWHVKGYRLSTHSSLDPLPQLMHNIYSTIRQNPPCFVCPQLYHSKILNEVLLLASTFPEFSFGL